ncbi:MAG: type II RES/Xre toxin-antitoxin system antitoxin [Janthinobacterium lividum]
MAQKIGVKNSASAKKNVEDINAEKNIVKEALMVYQKLCVNPIDLLSNSKKGLEAKAAINFINLSGFTPAEFQETFKTTVKTIQNYNRNELKLDAALSEKLLKSFILFEKGTAVFGSAGNFSSWLRQPAFGLGNQIPFEIMDTITGINLIDDELTRIAYGDLA